MNLHLKRHEMKSIIVHKLTHYVGQKKINKQQKDKR
jgi:hypothetical protein